MGPFGLEDIGVHLWVLGSLWGGWALGPFGYRGAPLGPSDPMGWVGIGFPWVPGSLWVGWASGPFGCWGAPLGPSDPMGWVLHPTAPLKPPPPPAQQQSQREVGETREQHIGRVLAQVAPGMMLCSLSEVICFCLGEPWGAPNGCCGGALRAAPWAISG